MNATVKAYLKKLRGAQPLNAVVTGATRGLLKSAGLESEFLIKHLHRYGSVSCPLPNGATLRLESQGDDWICNQLFWRGWSGYEPETLPLFFRLARAADVTLDVGAYIGLFAVLAGHANPQGRVYAFEPLPALHDRLKRHVRLNELRNVHCVNSALGDSTGTVEIFHQPGLTCTASLSLEYMQWQTGWKTSVVPLTTADHFIAEHKIERVDLIKIDTESTEPQVLTGMRHTIERGHPHIICEVLPSFGVEKSLTEILRPLGYHFYHLTDQGPIWREQMAGDLEFKNYLFSTTPPESVSQL